MKSYSKGRSTYKFGATTCNFKACGDKNGIQKQSQRPLSNVGRVTIHKTIWQVESDIKIPKDLREDTSEDKQVTLPLRSKIFQNIVKSHLGSQEKKKKKVYFQHYLQLFFSNGKYSDLHLLFLWICRAGRLLTPKALHWAIWYGMISRLIVIFQTVCVPFWIYMHNYFLNLALSNLLIPHSNGRTNAGFCIMTSNCNSCRALLKDILKAWGRFQHLMWHTKIWQMAESLVTSPEGKRDFSDSQQKIWFCSLFAHNGLYIPI